MRASAFMSLQPLPLSPYLQKSAACDSPHSSELALLVGFICTKGETFGLELSEAQTSVSQPARDAPSCQTPATLN